MVSPKVQHFPTPAAPAVRHVAHWSCAPEALRRYVSSRPRSRLSGDTASPAVRHVAHWSCAPEALRRYVPSRPRSRLSGDTASPAVRHVAQTALRRQTRESRKLSAHAWGFIKGFPPRRLRWTSRALELRSRYFPAVCPPPPVLFSFGKYFTTIPA